MYEDPDVWWKLILLMFILAVAWTIFDAIARKLLKVEKRKFFAAHHVNEKHKRIDWLISLVAIVCVIIGLAINITRDPMEWFWFWEPWFIMLLFLAATQIVKAIMERKYAENADMYKVTISNTVFISIMFLSLFMTDFWGLG